MIAELPNSAFPKFEALLPELPDKMVDQLMESVMALKEKPDEEKPGKEKPGKDKPNE